MKNIPSAEEALLQASEALADIYADRDFLESQDQEIKRLRRTLQDIMASHCNDNHRPKAFYIAAESLKKSLEWSND